MLKYYQENSRWSLLEQGYWYVRDDGKLKLWCSAIPAIGVAYAKFLSTAAELEKAHSVKKIDGLDDPTWATDDVMEELHRRFIAGEDTKLLDFARRSKRMAVSPDGRHVVFVRDNHAYDIENDFIVLNGPPSPDHGYSVQVINILTRNNDDVMSHQTALPKDANVDSVRFDNDLCQLDIQGTTTGRLIRLSGSADDFHHLDVGDLVHRVNNDTLWARLETVEANQRNADN
jgi:hypothetical protein